MNWLLIPFWGLQLFTGAKSFIDNPLIGSRRLNLWGLHGLRVRAAHAMTRHRRKKLGRAISPADKKQFDQEGFVLIPNFLPDSVFSDLRCGLKSYQAEARDLEQGHTVTRRFAIDPPMLAAIPALQTFRKNARWQGLARYVMGFRIEPLLYIQSVLTHRNEGPPDPQTQLHADTFHPSMKAWLFLEDVTEEKGAFTYVPGSHYLTKPRLEWEKHKSLTVKNGPCRLSARGSFRVNESELTNLSLPPPKSFHVPANTLIVADTFGFHARGEALERSSRIELWAYGRRNPFRLFNGFDFWSIPGIAERRIGLRWKLGDLVAHFVGQPWVSKGQKSITSDE